MEMVSCAGWCIFELELLNSIFSLMPEMRVLTAPLEFPIRAYIRSLFPLPLFKFVMLGPARAPYYVEAVRSESLGISLPTT
jgi:hypothetical protein